ncbi:MAG: tyrosine-type recombinase/integrase [Planktothrix sp.]
MAKMLFLPTAAKHNMAKKTFVHKTRIVKGEKWHIEFWVYDVEDQTEARHRKDFDLNKIEDITTRGLVAEIITNNLDSIAQVLLKPTKSKLPESEGMSLLDAIDMALKVKMASPRKSSHKNYKMVRNRLTEWAEKRAYLSMDVQHFTKKHAQAFYDHMKSLGKYRGVTLNNIRNHARGLWTEIISRDQGIKENPWKSIKSARVEEKHRRAFTEDEKKVVAAYIRETDYWLYRAVLLQYYCFIRPVELCRLRFKNFNYSQGTVTIEPSDAKKWKRRICTIPASIIGYFTDGIFNQFPVNHFIFGAPALGVMLPHTNPGNENRMYKRHKKCLEILKGRGDLNDINGLTWYSWKDTGISAHSKATTPLSTRDQAGHEDFKTTMIYYHKNAVNVEYRDLEDTL